MDNSRKADSPIYSKISGSYINRNQIEEESDESNSYMSFDGYLKLLVAQMQNQDFNNPMDDSEVLAQMAQYSMLEGIKNMTQQSSISYASSLVGKVVTVDDGSGSYTGLVEAVTVKNGEPYLMVDGMSYKSNTVTDIVQEDIYSLMISLIGHKVRSKDSDEDTAVTGVVTNVVYKDGNAYVVVNDKLYSLDSVVLVTDENEEGSEGGTEGTEGTEGTDGTDGTDGSGNVTGTEGAEGTEKGSGENGTDETTTETAEVEASAAMGYKARSESLIDSFMKELDEAGGVSKVEQASGTSGAAMEEYYVETMELEVPAYSAGAYADENVITGSVSSEGSDKVLGSGNSGTLTRSLDSESVNSTNSSSSYSYNSNYGSYSGWGYTGGRGVMNGSSAPARISVEKYPEEAALADRLGTRMYDIRFINNRAITSRIKTGEIIGHSSSGKAVTEIGYSGVGQLGEVVTFADGTQRVEVILKNGHSGWLTTSGRLTLDEICTRNGEPGSLTGKLTPEESAIRHFSNPLEDISPSLRNTFQNYVSRNMV